MAPPKQYSDAEKAAYYKRKAGTVARPNARKAPMRARRAAAPKKQQYRYPGVGRSVGEALGEFGGSFVPGGSGVGKYLGGAVGHGAQALIKHVTGFGDYTVKANSLIYNKDAVPEFSSDNQRCAIITHREFVMDVTSSTNFNLVNHFINPANQDLFPWLSQIAQNYEQYVIQGMIFEFKTTSATSVASSNTALGTVVMATQYNSLSPIFLNKQQMENYEFSQSCVPCQSMLHPIECDPMQTQCGGIFNMFVPNNESGDRRLYDIGRFSIATVGQQAANDVIGELWVSYKICLLKPRLQSIMNISDVWSIDDGLNSSNVFGFVVGKSTLNSGLIQVGAISGYSGNNNIVINPSFVGVLQIVYANSWATMTTATYTSPVLTIPSTSNQAILDYTSIIANGQNGIIGTAAGTQTQFYANTTVAIPAQAFSVLYIRCTGQHDTTGIFPYVQLTNWSLSGTTTQPGGYVVITSMSNAISSNTASSIF
nr:MAG: capsid protein [Cressdnaviricota sp.]